ncbi:Heavy metal-associated isoprenylated plant protein 3, partial [Mucuna pruriens]
MLVLQKKKTGGGNSNKENEDGNATVVLKVDMHCDGCTAKILKHLHAFQGVEKVELESDAGKVTVIGKVDPTKVREDLAQKMKKNVELVSPQPKKEKEKENKDTKVSKPDNKSENKTHDKKTKDKEAVTIAVLKMVLHCQGCIDKIRKTVGKTKGVQGIVAVDKEKETMTVKGTMDVKALAENLAKKFNMKVEVVSPKKDKDSDNKESEKEGSGKKKNKAGDGGGETNENNQEGGQMHNRMEYWPPAFGYGYGYGYGHGNVAGVNYVPVYPEQMHLHLHAPPPQMFSDENPNACSV